MKRRFSLKIQRLPRVPLRQLLCGLSLVCALSGVMYAPVKVAQAQSAIINTAEVSADQTNVDSSSAANCLTSSATTKLLAIASVSADQTNINTAGNSVAHCLVLGSSASTGYDLALSKSASPSAGAVGVALDLLSVVTNNGPGAASNVIFTDTLPVGVTYGSATATGGGTCQRTGGIVVCNWASLAASSSATVTVRVTP